MRNASCSACVSSSMLSPSMAHSLRGSTKTPFTYLGQVMHSAAQGSAAGVAPCACIRGTLYSWPVFATGAGFGAPAAAALARSLSVKDMPQVSAGGVVHREHCRAGLNILGKYHHLELAPTWPFACFIGILGDCLRWAARRSGVADVTWSWYTDDAKYLSLKYYDPHAGQFDQLLYIVQKWKSICGHFSYSR